MNAGKLAEENLAERIASNPYPGRGLVLGKDERGQRLVQVYWIMGRSQNSRNRVFETDGKAVWTEAADPYLCKDPSLIIYRAMVELRGAFIVSNGDQTDTVRDTLVAGGTFERALLTRTFEPDAPNYTPRIAGLFDLRAGQLVAKLGLIRRCPHTDSPQHFFWHYRDIPPGTGYCITTYSGDGDPLPPFEGEPYLVPIAGELGCIANTLWGKLDADNKISLCAKAIDPATLESELVVLNKYARKT